MLIGTQVAPRAVAHQFIELGQTAVSLYNCVGSCTLGQHRRPSQRKFSHEDAAYLLFATLFTAEVAPTRQGTTHRIPILRLTLMGILLKTPHSECVVLVMRTCNGVLLCVLVSSFCPNVIIALTETSYTASTDKHWRMIIPM